MEYIIKNNSQLKGKEKKLYDLAGQLMLTISEKLSSVQGKEVIYNNKDEVVYLVDTLQRKGQFQSTIFDATSKEILTVYLSRTFSGINLYVSSVDNKYAANHKLDMTSIHIYQNNEMVATVKSKKTLFGNNYILDIDPGKDDEFLHLLTMVIINLLEHNAEMLLANSASAN